MKKLLSILIPTYNRVDKLKKLLNCLEMDGAFKNEKIEIVISDNCSTDSTWDVLSSLTYNSVIVHRNESNIGLIGNVKTLLAMAKGDYVWLMGDDDIFELGLISTVCTILLEHPSVNNIFINHTYVHNGKPDLRQCYKGNGGLYTNGVDAVKEILKDSSLGVLMFITANIHSKECVIEAQRILDNNNESDNWAIPLAYSLYSILSGDSFIISKSYIYDEATNISWSDKSALIYCRDIVAAFDIIARNNKNYKELAIILKNKMSKFSFIKYWRIKNKFKKDNYAYGFLKSNFPLRCFSEIILCPAFLLYDFIRNLLNKG